MKEEEAEKQSLSDREEEERDDELRWGGSDLKGREKSISPYFSWRPTAASALKNAAAASAAAVAAAVVPAAGAES